MSSKASTTIGFERRFNTALAYDDVALFVAESTGVSTPRPPNMQRIVRAEPGPVRRRSARTDGDRRAPEGCPDPRRAADEAFAAGHYPGALSVPVSGNPLLDEGSVRPRLGPGRRRASDEDEVARRDARPVVGRQLDIAGYLLGGGPETLELVSDRATRCAPRGRRRAHRRAREGRARLRLHRREPQHPVPAARTRRGRPPARPEDRHDLRGRASGGDRREHPLGARLRCAPGRRRRHRLVEAAAGKPTVEFRRCGS